MTKFVQCSGVGRKVCNVVRDETLFIKIGKKRFCTKCYEVYKQSLWRLVPDIYGPEGLNWIKKDAGVEDDFADNTQP